MAPGNTTVPAPSLANEETIARGCTSEAHLAIPSPLTSVLRSSPARMAPTPRMKMRVRIIC